MSVTGYLLYRGSTMVARVSRTTRTYTASRLTAGTTYTWSVYAVDAAGNQGPAATATR